MKRKLAVNFIILFTIILILSSCQYFTQMPLKDWQNKNGSNAVDVYVGGYYTNGNQISCYWKNGVRTDLATNSTSTSDAVNSISVDGNNIYCGGYYTPSSQMACYWKNNNIIPLNNTINASSSYIKSIVSVNGIVFTCGNYFDNSTGIQTCFYVINDKQYILPQNPLEPALYNVYYDAYSIYVDPITLNFYIAGYIDHLASHHIPCYWVNGGECKTLQIRPSTLPPPTGDVSSIYFSNGKLYFAGTDGQIGACYWDNMNSLSKALSNGTFANSIVVYNEDIYVAGEDSSGNGAVWKNQQIVQTVSSSNCMGINVFNNDIYTCLLDSANNLSYYYKNNQQFTLPIPSGATTSNAMSIVVKPRN